MKSREAISLVIGRSLQRWHTMLGLRRQHPAWYKDRFREEMRETRTALTRWQKLSETADVFYILSRSIHDGHRLRALPLFTVRHLAAYTYLLIKYTSRWTFYRTAGILSSSNDPIWEVVNPAKREKLLEVARRHSTDEQKFLRVCSRLRRIWPLLP